MKWLLLLLPLAVLFAFTMPAVGQYAPAGDVVIEQAVGPPDLPIVEAEDLLSNADLTEHAGLAANYDSYEGLPAAALLMRQTSEPVQTVALRLWRPEGGVVFFGLSKPAGRPPIL